MAGRHAAKGIPGADLGYSAFVAVQASIMTHLQEERAIAKPIAPFDALRAADAKTLVDCVFIVGVLNIGALDGGGGTQAIFCPGIQVVRFGLEVSCAKLAIAADRKGVHALNCRLFQHAMRRAVPAAEAFLWIDLPHRSFGGTVSGNQP